MALFPKKVLTYAQMQAIGAGNAGREYFVTDAGVSHWVDDGTLLRPIVQGVLATEPPSAATFGTQVNWSTSTLTKTNGLLFINGASASGGVARLSVTTIPTPSACQIQAHAVPRNNSALATVANSSSPDPGLSVVMYEQSTGKFALMGFGYATSYQNPGAVPFLVTSGGYWASTSSRTSANDLMQWGQIPFFRLRISGGTVFHEQSWDLQTWDQINSVAVTTVFTTQPSHYGVATSHFNGAGSSYGHFDHLVLG